MLTSCYLDEVDLAAGAITWLAQYLDYDKIQLCDLLADTCRMYLMESNVNK
jgi:hypothetical protein